MPLLLFAVDGAAIPFKYLKPEATYISEKTRAGKRTLISNIALKDVS